MMRAVPFWFVYTVPAVALVGIALGGWHPLLTVAYVFGAIPLADHWVGRDDTNPGEASASTWWFDAPLLLWVPCQLALLLLGLVMVTRAPGSVLDLASAAVAMGLVTGGAGITIAHELMHRSGRGERALAEVLMTSVTYPHFSIEHVYGHHKNVATTHDPATSRLGESIYAFLPRTILGGVVSAWRIERARAEKLGLSRLSLRSAFTRYALTLSAIYAGVYLAFGLEGVAFFFLQSFFAVALLELINYVEHYGLQRRELSPGRYERVQPYHSWNSSHRITNWLLFNLQRHSDHHYLASRPFHQLRHYDQVPQLPSGYAAMVWLALLPPLWRRVMDPRVEQALVSIASLPANGAADPATSA